MKNESHVINANNGLVMKNKNKWTEHWEFVHFSSNSYTCTRMILTFKFY